MTVLFLPWWLLGLMIILEDAADGRFSLESLAMLAITFAVAAFPASYLVLFKANRRNDRTLSDHHNAEN
ncbi:MULTISPECIES: hypothetical protein [Sphingomonas]|jgi:hypothetical protein|uniref:hypothetical protein n=1 Tax=Sphingomonas TaxID=13687 RepID=UPI000AA5469D|nr:MULTISPECIES: hypothetical protein [Sphingomonas]MBY0302895.1 hypothetical protein [Sphingomonas ginsenosidimutans]